MTKKGQNVSQVSHKGRLAVLVSSARCDREEIGTLSCHIRRSVLLLVRFLFSDMNIYTFLLDKFIFGAII